MQTDACEECFGRGWIYEPSYMANPYNNPAYDIYAPRVECPECDGSGRIEEEDPLA